MTTRKSPFSLARVLLVAALGLLSSAELTQANPTGSQVIAGQVSMSTVGNSLIVTNSPGSIINWQSFSIAPGELTRFIQQNSSSAVLNRITGQDPSLIFGALQSNGKVFLVNPNGIVFGAGSSVNVGALAASTLGISNADFAHGLFDFSSTGKGAAVVNQGTISTPTGGFIYLMGADATNSGLITAPDGTITLAAGKSITLGDTANPNVQILVTAPSGTALNLGTLIAQSGRVGLYGTLVSNQGEVNANSAVGGANGAVLFKATDTVSVSGAAQATGAGQGGTIEVIGAHVSIASSASLDASGEHGGGSILIGGGSEGADAAIPDATTTTIAAGAQIRADAGQSGNGGQIVVWSNDETQMAGTMSARGGASAGNGGAAEVSSRGTLLYQGLTDLRAPAGVAGRLTLDPTDITVSADDSTPSSGDDPTSNISNEDLQNQLAFANVTLATFSGATAPAGGTITVNAPVSWSGATTLTLLANQGITLNSSISAPAGSLALESLAGNITQTAGSIATATLSATANAGAVSLEQAGNLVTSALAGHSSGAFSFANSGALLIGSANGVKGVSTSAGAITLSSAGSIDVADPTTGINAGTNAVTLYSGGAVTTSTGKITGGTLQISAVTGIGTETAPLSITTGSVQALNTTSGDIAIASTANLTTADVGSFGYGIENLGPGNIYLTSTSLLTLNGSLLGAGNIALIGGTGVNLYAPVTTTGSNGTVAVLAQSSDVSQNAPITAAYASAVATSGNVGLYSEQNAIGVIAGSSTGHEGFVLESGSAFAVGSVPAVGSIPGISGVSASGAYGYGIVLQSLGIGNITLNGAVYTPDAAVLMGTGGAIIQGDGGLITTNRLQLSAGEGGLGSPFLPLQINSGLIFNTTSQGGVYLNDAASAEIDGITAQGAVSVYSLGSLTTSSSTDCGCTNAITGSSVFLAAAGSITIDQAFSIQATNAITLSAGIDPTGVYLPSAGTLTVNGNLTAATIGLNAGGAISATGTLTGALTELPYQFFVAPTLGQCEATPSLTGCAAVLPSLTACTGAPTTPGCDVVLPSLTACTAAPATPGCTAVLPTLAACTLSPTILGCSAVLPSLAVCTSAPATAGCSAVLPTLAACTTAPTLPGCSVVLPTIAQCMLAPAGAGCSAVLPSLTTCTQNPTAPGCSVVLPSLAQCSLAPGTLGCSAVLPSLAVCTSAPMTAGCTAVLPSLAACTITPALAGCSAVLPTLAQCTLAPSSAGCNAMLPSLASCTQTPTALGCAAVLPSLATCTQNPTVLGCSAVLPSLAQCSLTPSTSGCSAVLPSLAVCTSVPTTAGCTAVLPTVAACMTAPALPGCSVVLPSLTQCTLTPSGAGCSAVLPSLATCTLTPTIPGCAAILPTLAVCSTTPATAGCSVVLPSLATCTATPTLAGCNAVLPTIAACSANPAAVGCNAVIPPVVETVDSQPVIQASSISINAVNTCDGTLLNSSSSSSSGSNNPGTSNPSTTSSTTGGTLNATPTKKLYCN